LQADLSVGRHKLLISGAKERRSSPRPARRGTRKGKKKRKKVGTGSSIRGKRVDSRLWQSAEAPRTAHKPPLFAGESSKAKEKLKITRAKIPENWRRERAQFV